MKTIYRSILTVALGVAALSASAQDLDPTVVVDRAYEGKLMEVHKPALEMAVPDSVMRFDLDFDYSVFDNPYKGSYEFNPYLLSMKPSAAVDPAGRFYLRAGAGYQLRPEFDMVWSPKMKEKGSPFHIDVYARHRSYFGKYYLMPSDGVVSAVDAYRGGFMNSKAGVNFGADWDKAAMDMNVGYYGNQRLQSGAFMRNYNALDADFSVGSKDMAAPSGFIYDLDLSYRRGALSGVKENNLDAELLLGGILKKGGRVNVGLGFEHDGYSGAGVPYYSGASVVTVNPHYIYESGRLYADVGLNVSKAIRDTSSGFFQRGAKEQIVYPDVTLRFSVIRNALMMFLKAGGGVHAVSNSDLIERNAFQDLIHNTPMGLEVERLNAVAGFEGRFGRRFNWNIHAGYADYASGILDRTAACLVCYLPYRTWNVGFEWLWKSDSFMADGRLTYRDAWGEIFRAKYWDVFRPAAFTGDVAFEYNYMRRVYVGVSCGFSTARVCDANDFTLPGYADLGVSAEYVTSRALSFWVKGGNLLGMAIPRNLMYVEKGPCFTLGISLKL